MSRYRVKTFQVTLNVAEQGRVGANRHIRGPEDAAAFARAILEALDAEREHFILLALDGRHRVLGFKVCASGGQVEASVDCKVVFRAALELAATAIVCAHNHPSGDPTPSQSDIVLTTRLVSVGALLTCPVLDHVVIGADCHVSLKESGMVPA